RPPPQPLGRRRMVLRHTLAGEVELPELGLRRRHALLGGAAIPFGRLGGVALDPITVAVADRDIELRRAMPLLGRAGKPSRRVFQPLWHPLAAGMQRAQGELALGIAG